MSDFSLFSFGAGENSLAHINNEREAANNSRNWLRPDEYNAYDIKIHATRSWRGDEMSDMSTTYDRDNLSGCECKNEVILPLFEDKRRSTQTLDAEYNQLPATCWKDSELVLTLRPEQCDDIRSRFEQFDYTVKISPIENKPDSFVVMFPDRIMAEKALEEANKIGYKLRKKRRPRPSPRCPIMFKALHPLKIRSGKAFSRNVLGFVQKGDLVIVNQVKGRRARLMRVDNMSNLGWVSLHTSEGVQLLEQTDVSIEDWKLLTD